MTDQPENEIIRITMQFRAALERQDKQALSRLVQSYQQLYARLKDKIDLLAIEIAEKQPTPNQVVKMTRYKSLMRQVEDELTDFQVVLKNEIQNVTQNAIGLSSTSTQRIMREYSRLAGIEIGFNRLPNSAIQTMIGFLQPESPLFKRIEFLAEANTAYVSEKLLEGIGLGYNPKKVAALIRDSLGNGLTDAMRMTRTAQNWAYREASRANYVNNSDVVKGWQWFADLGGDPCMACIALHGSFHQAHEVLDDHHNGRCTQIPVVVGFESPVTATGEEWFSQLPEAKQRELMGKEKHAAWQGGAFKFSELSTKHTDQVYGLMTTEKPLWELLGAEPPHGR